MITVKTNGYTNANIEHLKEILIRGFMDLDCSRKCENCPNKRVCLDVIASHRYLTDKQQKK